MGYEVREVLMGLDICGRVGRGKGEVRRGTMVVDLLVGDWISVAFESGKYPGNKWEIKGIDYKEEREVAAVFPGPRFEYGARSSRTDENKHH